MKKEVRKIFFDEELRLEAYFFDGVSQPFPPHFHEYYVIGFIESGRRQLSVCGREYTAAAGDILLFNPLDNHSCFGADGDTLTYGAFNIGPGVMEKLAAELVKARGPTRFSENLIRDGDLFFSLKKLHKYIFNGSDGFEKEELFLLTFSQLIGEYSQTAENTASDSCGEIEEACLYMAENFSERISLETLCKITSLSRASLVRAFAREKGISPYRYLENIRLNASKRLLEQGVSPLDAALRTGFSDQSHFTNFFKAYIGLTPKQYCNIFNTDMQLKTAEKIKQKL